MINIKPEIVQLLKSVDDVKKISYFYPESFAILPTVTYYELGNKVEKKADGKERSSNIKYQIDVWTKNSSEASKIAIQIDDLLSEKGFKRQMALDMYDKKDKIHHKTMRYKGIVNNKTFMVTQ